MKHVRHSTIRRYPVQEADGAATSGQSISTVYYRRSRPGVHASLQSAMVCVSYAWWPCRQGCSTGA